MSSNAKMLLVVGVLILGALLLFGGDRQSRTVATTDAVSNVTMVAGQQIVNIDAKGGYSPQKSAIQAGVPTVLRFLTNGSYDCSSAVRIPDLEISVNLPPTGTTDVPIGTLDPGTLRGTCAMGMYAFEIEVRG